MNALLLHPQLTWQTETLRETEKDEAKHTRAPLARRAASSPCSASTTSVRCKYSAAAVSTCACASLHPPLSERQRRRATETQRDTARHRHRERQRQSDRERQRERQRETEKQSGTFREVVEGSSQQAWLVVLRHLQWVLPRPCATATPQLSMTKRLGEGTVPVGSHRLRASRAAPPMSTEQRARQSTVNMVQSLTDPWASRAVQTLAARNRRGQTGGQRETGTETGTDRHTDRWTERERERDTRLGCPLHGGCDLRRH